MKTLYVRELTTEEKQALEKGLRSNSAFTVRRCQMLLGNAKGLEAQQIAERLQCNDETVQAAIHSFEREGLACLHEKSHRPQSISFSFSQEALARLPDMVATTPRAHGQAYSL